MIDWKALETAYNEDGVYSLQLEVGDVCEQGCLYCYMNAIPEPRNQLTDETVTSIIDDAHRLGITAIEWLGGEPLLREGIFDHTAHAADLGFRNNMWTGGLPLADKDTLHNTVRYCRHGLISVHVSTVDPQTYVKLHPGRPKEDLDTILQAVEEVLDAGYPPEQMLNSVTYTGMQSAEDMIATIDYFEEQFGIMTSLNVYHTYLRPGQSDEELKKFVPSRKDVARVYRRYCKQYGVKQLPMNCVNKQYCSATIAVLYDGSVTPCATIREEDAPKTGSAEEAVADSENAAGTGSGSSEQSANKRSGGPLYDIFLRHRDHLIFKRFKDKDNLPEQCRRCRLVDECWGCRSRAYAAGLGTYGPDPRCFRA